MLSPFKYSIQTLESGNEGKNFSCSCNMDVPNSAILVFNRTTVEQQPPKIITVGVPIQDFDIDKFDEIMKKWNGTSES